METFFFHPKVVHVPMALAVLMPLIAGGVLVAWRGAWLPPRAWIVPTVLQGILVLSAMAAMQSGERDEDAVERVVAERFIEEHEEAAEAFTWAAAGVFVLMGAALVMAAKPIGAMAAAIGVAGTIIVMVLGMRTGEAGGALVYKYGAAEVYVGGAQAEEAVEACGPGEEHDDDDDDDD